MKIPRISLFLRAFSLLGIVFFVLSPLETRAAGEQVDIFTQYGGDLDDWVFANSSGTATNGYTVRIGSFSENQSVVLSLSYNRNWIDNQLQVFGNGTSATQGTTNTAGSFVQTLLNTDDFFKGKQAWVVYSDNANLSASSNFGVVSSSNASYTISSVDPWITTLSGQYLQTSEGGVVGFGSVHGTNSTTGTIRVAAAPATALYWDADGAGLGGVGTWNETNTVWTNDSSGVSGAGPYAWGSTSAGNFTAGAGLTAHFGGTAATVTVSGTVQAHNGLTFASNSYTLTSGTINLAGSSAAANTVTVSTSGHTAIIDVALAGSNGMTKAGDGTARLDHASTYTGSTNINSGTLQANVANALQTTGNITVNSGGSLLISANNAVNDSASINLVGGTLALSGNNRSDVLGALTLTSNSVIDMGSGTGNVWLSFNELAAVLSPTTQLNIWNYEFGVDHIYFHGNTTNIGNATSLANVNFYSGAGTGFLSNGFLSGSELHSAVVPEPEVYATALLLLFGAAYHFSRRFKISRPTLPAPQG
jgi:autotransporter-associated beta strand protein